MLIAFAGVACFSVSAVAAPHTQASTFTISGTVKDTNGQGLADVTLVMTSDVTGTQVTFTNQSGNYSFNYEGGVSHSLRITPSKSGYVFSPLWVAFVSSVGLTGDQTTSFEGTQSSTPAGQAPVLLTQANSLSAAALDSVTWMSEPFGVANVKNFSSDQHSRISLFAANMDLAAGETTSVIVVEAEDSLGQVFPLTVEHFGAVPNFSWLKQIIVKLPDEIANKVEVRVSVKLRGVASNKVNVKVKP